MYIIVDFIQIRHDDDSLLTRIRFITNNIVITVMTKNLTVRLHNNILYSVSSQNCKRSTKTYAISI